VAFSAFECTKFVFGQGSAPDPAGGAYRAPPDNIAGLRRTLLLRGKGWGRRGEGRGEWPPPLSQIPGSAPVYLWLVLTYRYCGQMSVMVIFGADVRA